MPNYLNILNLGKKRLTTYLKKIETKNSNINKTYKKNCPVIKINNN